LGFSLAATPKEKKEEGTIRPDREGTAASGRKKFLGARREKSPAARKKTTFLGREGGFPQKKCPLFAKQRRGITGEEGGEGFFLGEGEGPSLAGAGGKR